jgi:hypothetical protein
MSGSTTNTKRQCDRTLGGELRAARGGEEPVVLWLRGGARGRGQRRQQEVQSSSPACPSPARPTPTPPHGP